MPSRAPMVMTFVVEWIGCVASVLEGQHTDIGDCVETDRERAERHERERKESNERYERERKEARDEATEKRKEAREEASKTRKEDHERHERERRQR